MPKNLRLGAALIICAAASCGAWAAETQDPLADGLDWIATQEGADGVFVTEGSVAAPPQAVAEAIRARNALAPDGGATAATNAPLLADWADENTEFLLLHARNQALAGADTSALRTELLARQNGDGGFADAVGHPSSLRATASVLAALAELGVTDEAVTEPAIIHLLDRQAADGSWSDGDAASILVTATAVQALAGYSDRLDLANPIEAGVGYLLAQRTSTGGFDSVWEGAVTLLAVMPAVTDPGRYATTLQWLGKTQTTSGSWNDDLYETALALQALDLAARLSADGDPIPPAPTDGVVTGTVLDGTTGSPVPGVQVVAGSPADATATVGDDGRFELSLPADEAIELTYSASGYAQAVQTVTVNAGGTLDLGEITLSPLPDQGRLYGTVSDSDTGQAITSATIQVTGATSVQESTGSDGRFDLALDEGAHTVTAQATGYHPISIGIDMVAGQSLRFPVPLVPDSQPTGDGPSSITGRVTDRETGAALDGAQVTITSTGTNTSTASDGAFELAGVASGSYDVAISKDGYTAAGFHVVLPAGVTAEAGTIALAPSQEPTSTTVFGVITAIGSGDPIAGATVEAAGQSAVTGTDGSYRVEGITATEFAVNVAAEGYVSRQASIQLAAPGTVNYSAGLKPVVRSGIEVSALRADAPAYEAYSAADLELDIANVADASRFLRLRLEVVDAGGQRVTEGPVFTDSALDATGTIELAAGESRTERFAWFTEALPPGGYILKVHAFRASDSSLVAERSLPVEILLTRELELISLQPDPLYTTQGSTQDVDFEVLLLHRSNVTLNGQVSFELRDPDGVGLHQGVADFALPPEARSASIPVTGTSLVFDQPGEHPVAILEVTGVTPVTTHGQSFFVAPGTRLEISQGLDPGEVPPDGAHRLQLEILLEGEEQ